MPEKRYIMKPTRHVKILEIIENRTISTQQELRNALLAEGYDVTQATVSRDINDLKLIKVRTPSGKYAYGISSRDETLGNPEKFSKLFSEAMIKADAAQNIVVIKTYPGMANALCSLIDAMRNPDIVGTIAGDDTIFVVLRTNERAQLLKQELQGLIE